MKSQRPAAADDTADPTGSAAVSGSGGSGPATGGSEERESGPNRRGATGSPGSGSAGGNGRAALPAEPTATATPPEPAGDAPGPVVDGRPTSELPAATSAETSPPSGARSARAKRNKARPVGTSPAAGGADPSGPAEPDGGEAPAVTAAGTAAATDEAAEAPAAIPPPSGAEGTRRLDVGAAATASDPLAVPELVALPLREDQGGWEPVGSEDAEADAAPQPDRGSAPNPALAALAFVRGSRRTMIRSRKVRRVIRHVDPWSVLTFSVIFHLCLFGALLLAGTLVWSAASASGTIDNIESLVRDLGDYETWEIQGDAVLRAGFIVAGMLTLASTIMVVLLTVVFNLISDLVGGIRVTVIEEEVHHGAIPGRKEGAAPEPEAAAPADATIGGPQG